jgi:hypothetical protein
MSTSSSSDDRNLVEVLADEFAEAITARPSLAMKSG